MTDSLKYSIGALALLIGLFLYNQSVQKSHSISGESIFTGNNEDVFRVVISEFDKSVELVRADSTWTISQADTLLIKENQIKNLFDRKFSINTPRLDVFDFRKSYGS